MAPTDRVAVAAGDFPSRETIVALLVGAAVALAVAAVWVLLTGLTGKTYHLAPPIAAAAPGAVLHLQARGGSERVRALVIATVIGALAVLLGWSIIAAAGFDLGSTVIADQPGGVDGEVLTGGLIGLAVGAYLGRDRR